jgi:hypothetical protein
MTTFLIECFHNIYVDHYENGELDNVNNYDTEGKYSVSNIYDAIEKHLASLGYDFNKDFCQLDEENTNVVFYSVLVDAQSYEATTSQIELWKQNKFDLYSNNLTLYVYEVANAKID